MRTLRSVRLWLLALVMLAVPASSFAGVFISVNLAPPPLPVYEQPMCPGDGYIWTPGYWAYGDDGYYWVPGTWVMAPEVGFLWTPGYWGWGGSAYLWHVGYWGPHVGYYGGVNYGYGYIGRGYEGGRWDHDHFFYNRSVNNVNVTNIRNVYSRTVVNNVNVSRVSYNGGNGGVRYSPGREEQAAMHDRHIQETSVQSQHEVQARSNRQQFASVNHGQPPITATQRPGVFNNSGVNRGAANDTVRSNQQPNREQFHGPRPLVTARPSNGQNAQPARAYNTPGSRPAYNGQGSSPAPRTSNDVPRQQAAPRNVPEPRGNAAPQPRYTAAPQREVAPPQRQAAPQPRYSPAPQREVAPPQRQAAPQPRYSPGPQREAAPQRQAAPQPHYNAPPQARQPSAPRQESAPRQQSAPHGGGEPHGDGGGEHRR